MGATQSLRTLCQGQPDPSALSIEQAEPQGNDNEHLYEPQSCEESFFHYRRSFGLVWQAFRLAGHDRQLQPETVHHILKLADIAPFEVFDIDYGNKEATWRAVQTQHRYVPDQDELCTTLDVNSSSQLLEIQFYVSSRDQGWVGDPNAGSWTWAECSWVDTAGNEIPGHSRVELFRNELQVRAWQEHEIRIDDPEFLSAQPGEKAGIALWIRSRFGGWQHYVRYAKISAIYKPKAPWPEFTPIFRH